MRKKWLWVKMIQKSMLNLGKVLNRLKWSTFKAEGRWDVDDQGLTPHRTFLLLA
jgi:hypothetical protein